MKIESRSYSSKVFRPRPVTNVSSDENTLVIASSWGDQAIAERTIEEVIKFIEAASSDVEVTTPFELYPQLSKDCNDLNVAIQIANEQIFRTENKSEYSVALELIAFRRTGSLLSYAQVGMPNIFLQREGYPLQPLSCSVDLRSPPLPKELLGINQTVSPRLGSLHIKENDSLYLLSSSVLAPEFFTHVGSSGIQELTNVMARVFPENPFWIGRVDLG
ncbi:MAG: hypothetical protein ACLGGX_01495 [Bdellovibrionia bacterium]